LSRVNHLHVLDADGEDAQIIRTIRSIDRDQEITPRTFRAEHFPDEKFRRARIRAGSGLTAENDYGEDDDGDGQLINRGNASSNS